MRLGKPRPQVMADTVFRLKGSKGAKILVGPRPGVDTSVLNIRRDQVMIIGSDPVSLIPEIGPRESAWLSVHASASDIATSGVAPRYAMFDLNLPPFVSDKLLGEYWQSIHKTCTTLGISILGGHTGRFEGCNYTVVGGVTMIAFGQKNGYVTSEMARDGDDIIATKTAALEATAVLARSFPRTVRKRLGGSVLERSFALLKETSVVKDALVAASVGLRERGVSAMHDVTEGGVFSALLELADASNLKVTVNLQSVPVEEEVREVCRFFGIDPFHSLGQGCLLVASRPQCTPDVSKALRRAGIASSVIGKLARGHKHTVIGPAGEARTLAYPRQDPYWRAYWTAVRKGWA